MEDGRSITTAEVLDDISQIGRMKVGKFLLRDTQVEEV